MSASTVAMIRPPGGQGFREGEMPPSEFEKMSRDRGPKKKRPKVPAASRGAKPSIGNSVPQVPRGEGKRPTISGSPRVVTRDDAFARGRGAGKPKNMDPMKEISGDTPAPKTAKKSVSNYNNGVF